ncbi:DUF192 domain-containing protein [Flavobacteriaceae bacterium XHP0103]|uniref:DUF192 domain-containing protein n=1 Tax=Marixanthotalea marina TaxID=2844359 RepID=UPI002989C0C4|nr:DUF192 domain-containing protein [Marixanthotalea marina]MBU3822614.1 DUF192 domain-containing protein [Marixanthotalea marina]
MKVLFKTCILTMMLIGFYACKEDKKTTVKQTEVSFTKEGELVIHKIATDSTEVKLDIEIADTEFDTQTGLMYRSSMKTNQAMLFVFDDVTQRYFYMKNTQFPLDIIYVGENKKIVSFQKNAKPLDENSLPSNVPAKYVLEINAGLSDQWTLKVGDSLSWY